ncbi:hypothetical protein L2E82_35437 [Cichorium intybus]|uniref:Uncharacterized protein n=1 Tax=Cichorium intybus TaxID=13427 RepID=A0ACB9BNS9_CICIN|nr:hypothetical protein L2E82_35437 [Cichorium intybus]
MIHPRDPSDSDNTVKIAIANDTNTSIRCGSGSGSGIGISESHIIESGNLIIFVQVLKNVTKNFSQENELGRGGFGVVYKGQLHDGTKIAFKRMEARLKLNPFDLKESNHEQVEQKAEIKLNFRNCRSVFYDLQAIQLISLKTVPCSIRLLFTLLIPTVNTLGPFFTSWPIKCETERELEREERCERQEKDRGELAARFSVGRKGTSTTTVWDGKRRRWRSLAQGSLGL